MCLWWSRIRAEVSPTFVKLFLLPFLSFLEDLYVACGDRLNQIMSYSMAFLSEKNLILKSSQWKERQGCLCQGIPRKVRKFEKIKENLEMSGKIMMPRKNCSVTFICFQNGLDVSYNKFCVEVISNYVFFPIWHIFNCSGISLKCVAEISGSFIFYSFHFPICENLEKIWDEGHLAKMRSLRQKIQFVR